jgi:hypothetical protein
MKGLLLDEGVLSALVKYSRQFKQREKRLLKVVTVNLYHYTNNYNTKKLHFVVRRLSNVGEAVPQKWGGGKSTLRKDNWKHSKAKSDSYIFNSRPFSSRQQVSL